MNSIFKKSLHKVLFLVLTLVCVVACKKQATQPLPPLPKDPRTYTWTIDTLKSNSGQTLMRSIWGSSTKNIYTVGWDAGSLGDMFHFDGQKWKIFQEILTPYGGPLGRPFGLQRILGVDANNIWVVGRWSADLPEQDSTLILHFNGQNWQSAPTVGGHPLQGIWGTSPDDIWAGGVKGALYHYDGVSWQQKQPPRPFWYNSFAGLSTNEVYALAYEYDAQGRGTRYLSMWDGVEWRILQSFTGLPREGAPFGDIALFAVDGQLFSAGNGVFRKIASGWEKLLSPAQTVFYGMHGTAADNLFLVGIHGRVYHYNGTDWDQLIDLAFYGLSWYDVWTDGTETFIVGNDGGVSYVAHGK